MKKRKAFCLAVAFCVLPAFLSSCTENTPGHAAQLHTRTVPQTPRPVIASTQPAAETNPTPAALHATPAPAVAKFSTDYKGGNKNRIHNIKRAADAINGTILQPGETFSFNETVGPASKQAGYKKARIFVRGQDAEGYGGGICQVSSTLYNAADLAGLEITERHPHSKKVSYVPDGRDAATSYGGVDLRFTNTKTYPIQITATTTEETITTYISEI